MLIAQFRQEWFLHSHFLEGKLIKSIRAILSLHKATQVLAWFNFKIPDEMLDVCPLQNFIPTKPIVVVGSIILCAPWDHLNTMEYHLTKNPYCVIQLKPGQYRSHFTESKNYNLIFFWVQTLSSKYFHILFEVNNYWFINYRVTTFYTSVIYTHTHISQLPRIWITICFW